MRVDTVVRDLRTTVRNIVDALSNRLTVTDNFQATVSRVVSPLADQEFTVVHGLGRVPIGYIANVDSAAIVYDSRRSSWTASELYLKCNMPGVVVNLVVW